MVPKRDKTFVETSLLCLRNFSLLLLIFRFDVAADPTAAAAPFAVTVAAANDVTAIGATAWFRTVCISTSILD